jgi:hypothetical protein
MGAMAAGAAASGTRAWLAAWKPAWLTPARLRRITVALLGAGLLASATLLGGAG